MNISKNLLSSGFKKRVRMRDVATRAGVSISTVSLVLSGDPRIPEDTARKVLQTVKAMEYRPSILARSLAKKGSRTIAVILPETAFRKNQAYYYEILEGIHSETQPAGYKMLVEAANRSFLERRYYLRLLKEQSADGIIYLAANNKDTFLSEMGRENYPFVLLGNKVEGIELASMTPDESAGAALAVDHLISLGHSAIGHLSGSSENSSAQAREKGYRAAMAKAGLKIDPSWIISGDSDIRSAEKAAEKFVSTKVTAIFSANDIMAYGLIKGLTAFRKRVPEDVAVVGMDDLDISSWINPPLTTVRTNVAGMAAQATRYVLKILQNPSMARTVTMDETMKPQLIVRSSCGSKN